MLTDPDQQLIAHQLAAAVGENWQAAYPTSAQILARATNCCGSKLQDRERVPAPAVVDVDVSVNGNGPAIPE